MYQNWPKYLDFINVMTYDFHGQWEEVVGHNSPLFPLNSASSFQKKLTVDFAAKEWARQGAPLEKLIIGMPVYGRTFTLEDPAKFDVGAAATAGGKAGKYTGEAGFLSYYEICDFLHEPNTTLFGIMNNRFPLLIVETNGLDLMMRDLFAQKSIGSRPKAFGGIMVWSVDLDDFRGYCGTGKFPLIKAMRKEMEGYLVEWNYKGPYEKPGDNVFPR